ncbi:MAG: GtrA family protein [Deltaproteobacteria bacterium]|jgi:putative flippase GtrA|nr:GtrA family protein [Deltaproteobacteria bacterium]
MTPGFSRFRPFSNPESPPSGRPEGSKTPEEAAGARRKIRELASRSLFENQKLNYLIVGGLNTAFGYVSSFLMYYTLYRFLHIVAIGVLSTVVNITFSFCSYKIMVFRTKGDWLKEYLRCYAVYFLGSVVSITGVWLSVDFLKLPFWLAQGLVMGAVIISSYVGHSRFTFKRKKAPDNP